MSAQSNRGLPSRSLEREPRSGRHRHKETRSAHRKCGTEAKTAKFTSPQICIGDCARPRRQRAQASQPTGQVGHRAGGPTWFRRVRNSGPARRRWHSSRRLAHSHAPAPTWYLPTTILYRPRRQELTQCAGATPKSAGSCQPPESPESPACAFVRARGRGDVATNA